MAALVAGMNLGSTDVAPSYLEKEKLEQALDGVLISDLNGNLQFVKQVFAWTHGYSETAVRGRHLSL